jgi:hypothetical protein
MATEKELSVNRIIEIGEAVAVVADNKYLEGTIAYRLGRLGDFCKSPVRVFQKQRDKMLREVNEIRRKKLNAVKNGSSEEKAAVNDELNDLTHKLEDDVNSLVEQFEKIRIPELKLSDFIAKSDITELVEKDGRLEPKVIIKTGQSLVPVKFFTLMGDVITDDKGTGI